MMKHVEWWLMINVFHWFLDPLDIWNLPPRKALDQRDQEASILAESSPGSPTGTFQKVKMEATRKDPMKIPAEKYNHHFPQSQTSENSFGLVFWSILIPSLNFLTLSDIYIYIYPLAIFHIAVATGGDKLVDLPVISSDFPMIYV